MTRTRAAYRFRGPETWAAAREAFIAGETAAAIAARFGVTAGAIRQRAYREGWTRKALAAAAEAPVKRRATLAEGAALASAATPSGPAPEPYALLDIALTRAAAAMQAGHGEEALRMANLGERLLHLAEDAQRRRPVSLEVATAACADIREMVETAACVAAKAALTDPETAPQPLREWARKWRAEHAAQGS